MDWLLARFAEGDDDRIRDMVHRAERTLGERFPAFVLGLTDYVLPRMVGPLLDPARRTRLLAAPIPERLASDSAVSLLSERALAKAAGDEVRSRRFAEAASSLFYAPGFAALRRDPRFIRIMQGEAK